MIHEEFICEVERDVSPLIVALHEHGGGVIIQSPPDIETAMVVHLCLPEDEYRGKRCRQIVTEWCEGC